GAKATAKIPMLVMDPTAGTKAEPPNTGRSWQVPLGIGAMAVGAAGLGVGGLLGGLAIAKKGDSNAGPCNAQNQCTPEGLAMRSDAGTLGNVSTIAFIAGGVLAAGGVVLTFALPAFAGGKESSRASRGSARFGSVRAPEGDLRVRATLGGFQLE